MTTWKGTDASPLAKKLRVAVKAMMLAFEEERPHPPEVRAALQQSQATSDSISDTADYEYPLTLFPLDQPLFEEPTAVQRKHMQEWNDFAVLWNHAHKPSAEASR